MHRYDANPALSAFAFVIGALLGIEAAYLLGAGQLGMLVGAVLGVMVAGVVATSLGIVGERRPERSDDDLPPGYHDY